MDLGGRLRSLGLEQYEEVFRENKISEKVLPKLTAEDLKELGVNALGHRRILLDAIAALHTDGSPKAPTAEAPSTLPKPFQDTAERRQVTVMFSDLVGSTALSARMDPEDLREVISAYQKCVAETVQRFGGFVAKYMGDGVLVYFGYPQAHEDDAERAVRAGLELIRAVGGLKSSTSLQTRVGVATGLVVVGDLVGSGESQERGIVGETPNVAARLQGIAEANNLVIAESTRKLIGNLFELQDLGARDLKGLGNPVRAWSVLREASVASRFEALRAGGLTELVGREEELEVLLQNWSKAKTGEGQVVVLSGEAGIGKSRLTVALLEHLATEPSIHLSYFCSPQHTDSALYPIISQMGRAARLTHDDTNLAKLDKLDALLARTSTPSHEAALFADMLSLRSDGHYPTIELTPEQRRNRTLEALVSLWTTLTEQSSVLMIFEDAHWSDPTSLELFGRIVDRVSTLRILLIVTFRPEFNAPWIGRHYVTSVTIDRLAERDIAVMVDRVASNQTLPANIRQDIIKRTDGVPLFIEETTKAVLEAGAEAVAQRMVPGIPSATLTVPATLQASLMARLDRLGLAKEVAQIGALIGRSFSHELINAVAQMPGEKLNNGLEELVRAELIFQDGFPPHAEYTFKHALVQDAAYSALLRARRHDLHARIAQILEAHFPERAENEPELLAHHFTEAGLGERAIDYWLKAGQHAMARSAMTEAVSQLRKGLQLLSTIPESKISQQQELDLQIALGRALIATRGYTEETVGETYTRARQLCEKLGQNQQLLVVMFGEWLYHALRGEITLALGIADDLLSSARNQNDLGIEYLAHSVYLRTFLVLGEFRKALSHGEQALHLYDPSYRDRLAALTAEDPQCATQMFCSLVLICLGYPDQARRKLHDAIATARSGAQAHTIAYATGLACWCNYFLRDAQSLAACLEEVLVLSNSYGFPLWEAFGNHFRGYNLTQDGHHQEGIDLISKYSAGLDMAGMVTYRPFRLMLLAEAYRESGQLEEGLKRTNAAAEVIEVTQERVFEAEVHRTRGDLLVGIGYAAAEESYHNALAVARQQHAKFWELRAAMSMARLWRDQGKREEARELLAPVYGWFTEGFDTLDLKEAKALLEELA
jgi:class 3 adenylate cyclase/tetratricopeptide (TPR) repeat protein